MSDEGEVHIDCVEFVRNGGSLSPTVPPDEPSPHCGDRFRAMRVEMERRARLIGSLPHLGQQF